MSDKAGNDYENYLRREGYDGRMPPTDNFDINYMTHGPLPTLQEVRAFLRKYASTVDATHTEWLQFSAFEKLVFYLDSKSELFRIPFEQLLKESVAAIERDEYGRMDQTHRRELEETRNLFASIVENVENAIVTLRKERNTRMIKVGGEENWSNDEKIKKYDSEIQSLLEWVDLVTKASMILENAIRVPNLLRNFFVQFDFTQELETDSPDQLRPEYQILYLIDREHQGFLKILEQMIEGGALHRGKSHLIQQALQAALVSLEPHPIEQDERFETPPTTTADEQRRLRDLTFKQTLKYALGLL
jgi:hypothetical protein